MHTAGILRELGIKSLFYIYAFGVVPWGWHTLDKPIPGTRVSMSVFVGPAWMLLFWYFLKFLLSIPVGMVAVPFGIHRVIRGMRNARRMRQVAERLDASGGHIAEKS